jgi:hypothetical protein
MYIYIYVQTPWLLVRKRAIPTERPPLVDEIYIYIYSDTLGQYIALLKRRGSFWLGQRIYSLRNYTRNHLYFFFFFFLSLSLLRIAI